MAKPVILVIGGLDPQGCAGIAADIATINHHDCHALPLITALTQQTSSGLISMGAVDSASFMLQYHSMLADFKIDTIKIGLIPSLAIAQSIKHIIFELNVPVVLDPVLASSSGGVTVETEVQQYIIDELLPHISVMTPNLPELEKLTAIRNKTEEAVNRLMQNGLKACLVKGGHSQSDYATDYFASELTQFYLYQSKYAHNVRGTGCVLASSITCYLACGHDLRDAVVLAKAYISRGIRLAKQVGPYSVIEHSRVALQLQDMPKLCYSAELVGKQFEFPSCPQRLGIYPVVDSSDWVNKLIKEGIKTIQLRIKNASKKDTHEQICQALAYCDNSIAFFVNDYWQMAIEMNAYGVHLGQEDLHDANVIEIEQAGLRLGVSTHSYWELARALAINPSYIALGPVFETTSKKMPWLPQGIEKVKQWTQLLGDHYPLVAIGGINSERAIALKETGVGSVAMISAITQADDYKKATKELIDCWQ